jgi:hypothetical protein
MDLFQKFRPPWAQMKALDEVIVVGTEEFLSAVEDTRDLLLRQAPDSWEYIQRNVGLIREYEFSCASPYVLPPTVYLKASPSRAWCACVLVHEARHCELYRARQRGEALPMSEFEEETDCTRVSIELAERLDLPAEDIKVLIEYPEGFRSFGDEDPWASP